MSRRRPIRMELPEEEVDAMIAHHGGKRGNHFIIFEGPDAFTRCYDFHLSERYRKGLDQPLFTNGT